MSSVLMLNACGGHSSFTGTNPNSKLKISATLPAASVGSNYSASLTVTGGTAPYNFSLASGTLPAGVQLAKSGKISGKPSASGDFNFSVAVSDAKGDSQQKALKISVADSSTSSTGGSSGGSFGGSSDGSSGGSSAKSFSNVQKAGGWSQYGQGPPNFVDCSPSPCDGITFSMGQGVSNPSMSGAATRFDLGGTTPYSDGLWNNHLIGPLSSQGTFDTNRSLVPNLHDFTYDVYFCGDNLDVVQALEFDVNQFFNGMGFIFGHECRIAGGGQWDVYDNKNAHWVSTGVPCHPKPNSWNHVVLKAQRTSDNHLTYQSITLNGTTTNLNWTFEHGSAPNWYGVTLNYQMDGNFRQNPYHIFLDNLTLSYE